MSKQETHRNRESGAWRTKPATELQLEVLRRIASETGQTFATDITRGEASKIIDRRFADDPKARRAHRRAERARRRDARRLVNPAATWRFGAGQTSEQEAAELRRARRDGLEDVYMRLQKWVHGHRALADREAG